MLECHQNATICPYRKWSVQTSIVSKVVYSTVLLFSWSIKDCIFKVKLKLVHKSWKLKWCLPAVNLVKVSVWARERTGRGGWVTGVTCMLRHHYSVLFQSLLSKFQSFSMKRCELFVVQGFGIKKVAVSFHFKTNNWEDTNCLRAAHMSFQS